MRIGCVSVVGVGSDLFVGINCSKGRGIILPGGKWEPEFNLGETFKDCAARELKEEAGLKTNKSELLFHGPSGDGFYVYAFRVVTNSPFNSVDHGSGRAGIHKYDEFMKSQFKAYYELMFEAYFNRGASNV